MDDNTYRLKEAFKLQPPEDDVSKWLRPRVDVVEIQRDIRVLSGDVNFENELTVKDALTEVRDCRALCIHGGT